MLSCNTDNAKEQAEEGERYEAVTAGCGKGGVLTHFHHTPHTKHKTTYSYNVLESFSFEVL